MTTEVAKDRHPMAGLIGDLKDTPPEILEEWKAAMVGYRRQRDAEDNIE